MQAEQLNSKGHRLQPAIIVIIMVPICKNIKNDNNDNNNNIHININDNTTAKRTYYHRLGVFLECTYSCNII